MRVVHVVDHLGAVGGVRTYLEVLLPGLEARGIENVVVTAAGGESRFAGVEVISAAGIEADGVELDAGTRGRLRAALERARPDVVYVQVAPSPSVAAEAARLAPTLLYAHDYGMVCPGNARYLARSQAFCDGPGVHCFWRAYTERTMSRRPDRILRAVRRVRAWEQLLPGLRSLLVASPFVARQFEAAGAGSGTVKVVPPPVAAVPPVSEQEVRSTDVLFVGRLIASKGGEVLLRALAELPGATATIAGDGPDRAPLEALAAELGMSERLRFTGWVSPEERLDLFNRSRVLAFPALWQEPFGLIGLEALAAGLPVVASDAGGIPSWLVPGEGGLLVPPGDVARLAAALRSLLGDEVLRAQLGARGPEIAARFSIDHHLDLLLPELEQAT